MAGFRHALLGLVCLLALAVLSQSASLRKQVQEAQIEEEQVDRHQAQVPLQYLSEVVVNQYGDKVMDKAMDQAEAKKKAIKAAVIVGIAVAKKKKLGKKLYWKAKKTHKKLKKVKIHDPYHVSKFDGRNAYQAHRHFHSPGE